MEGDNERHDGHGGLADIVKLALRPARVGPAPARACECPFCGDGACGGISLRWGAYGPPLSVMYDAATSKSCRPVHSEEAERGSEEAERGSQSRIWDGERAAGH